MKNLLSTKLNGFYEKSLSKSQLKTIIGGTNITDPNNDEDRGKKKRNSPTS